MDIIKIGYTDAIVNMHNLWGGQENVFLAQ